MIVEVWAITLCSMCWSLIYSLEKQSPNKLQYNNKYKISWMSEKHAAVFLWPSIMNYFINVVQTIFSIDAIFFFTISCYQQVVLIWINMKTQRHSLISLIFWMLYSVQVSKSACILTTQAIMKLLKSKEAATAVDIKTWPTILDTGTKCLTNS